MSDDSDSSIGDRDHEEVLVDLLFGDFFDEYYVVERQEEVLVVEEIAEIKEERVSELEEDLTDEAVEEFLDLEFILRSLDVVESKGKDLEGLVPETRKQKLGIGDESGDFYKAGRSSQDVYDVGVYDEKDDFEGDYVVLVDDAEGFVELKELWRGGRSMLEIAGFFDEVAEKKRKEKRSFFRY